MGIGNYFSRGLACVPGERGERFPVVVLLSARVERTRSPPLREEKRREERGRTKGYHRLPLIISLIPSPTWATELPYMRRTRPETNVHDLTADLTGKSAGGRGRKGREGQYARRTSPTLRPVELERAD